MTTRSPQPASRRRDASAREARPAALRRRLTMAALAAAAFALAAALAPRAAAGQDVVAVTEPPAALAPVSVAFEGTDIREVARFFAAYAGRSIVVGAGVEGAVTADIVAQPWDVALAAILDAQGLRGRELESGILVVERGGMPAADEVGALVTRVFRLAYADAAELQPAVQGMLTERGSVSVLPGANALVVTDVEATLGRVAGLLGRP